MKEALAAYFKRKQAQINHCEMYLSIANQAMNHLADNPEIKDQPDDVIDIGRPDYFDNLVFD